jgi:uroporphyrinogen-III synthase
VGAASARRLGELSQRPVLHPQGRSDADALAALTLELLRRHTLDELRALRDAGMACPHCWPPDVGP